MSIDALKWAKDQKVGNPTRKLILMGLAECSDHVGRCWPSYTYLAGVAECSEKSASRHVQALESMGLLSRGGRRRDARGYLGAYNYQLHIGQERMTLTSGESLPDNLSSGQSGQWTNGESLPDKSGIPSGHSCVRSEPSLEPSPEPGEGARARDPVDNSQSRSIRWGTATLNLSAAPPELSDDAVREWLQWRSDRRLPIAPLVVHQVMLELGRAQQRGWDPNEALSIWMTAGWSTFRAEYLDRMRAQTEREASSTPATAEIDTAWEAVLEVADRGGTIADVDRRVMGIVSAMGGPPALAPLNAKQRAKARQDFGERYTRERQRKTAAAGG